MIDLFKHYKQCLNMDNKIDTIVISGGSINGFILMGSVQYIYDCYNIHEINTFCATSAGAMISYLLCIGYKPIEILVNICTSKIVDKLKNNIDFTSAIENRGAVSFSEIEREIENLTYSKIGYIPTLLDIKEKFGKHLVITTYNLDKNESVYLDYTSHPDLSCLTAVRMTSSIPLLFEKCIYKNEIYIDGASHDNFPIEKALEYSSSAHIIGVTIPNRNPIKLSENLDMKSMLQILLIPVNSKVNKLIEKYKDKIIIIDTHEDNGVEFYNFNINNSKILDMFSNGYERAQTVIENIKHSKSDNYDSSLTSDGT
jgi:predicted acylesterase/phospholipase RssA